MNEGYISIVSHNDFESVLRCFEEGGFLPESPTGECKLLDEVGDQVVVTEAKFRSEFSLPSAFGDALGLLWKNWETITWHRHRSANGLQLLTLYTGWASSKDFENTLRIVLHCASIICNPNLRMIIADRRGAAELSEWHHWLDGGFLPSLPPELLALQKSSREMTSDTLPGFGFAKVGLFEVFWNPILFEKDPTSLF